MAGGKAWCFQPVIFAKILLVSATKPPQKFGVFFPKKARKENRGEVWGRLAQLSTSQTLHHGYVQRTWIRIAL